MTVIAMDVRYRVADVVDPGEWISVRFPVGQDIRLDKVVRGLTYDIELRNVDHTGRLSLPVEIQHTVATTVREGALALPVNAFANRGSVWNVDTSVTYSATDSVATISVSAGTLVSGGRTISYSASSAEIPGTPEEQKVVYLYYDDPWLQGGPVDLGVTDDYITSLAGDGRIAITTLTITFPAVGAPPNTGGGGIGGGGGGGGAGNIVQDIP